MTRHQVIARQIKGLENMLIAAMEKDRVCSNREIQKVEDQLNYMRYINDKIKEKTDG